MAKKSYIEKLGLKPYESMTPANAHKRAAELTANIAKGKYHGALLARAKRYLGHYQKLAATARPKARPKAQTKVVVGQGFLPNFLEGESVVKLQEMIQQRLFKAIESTLRAEIAAIESGLNPTERSTTPARKVKRA